MATPDAPASKLTLDDITHFRRECDRQWRPGDFTWHAVQWNAQRAEQILKNPNGRPLMDVISDYRRAT
jgi:hypothetical protein